MGTATIWTSAGATAVTAGLTLSLCGALPVTSTDEQGSTEDQALAEFHDQEVEWHECEDFYLVGFDCATVEVPLDYGEPEGERITWGEPQIRRGR